MTTTPNYTATEMIVCLGARLMKGCSTVFIGTGLPLLAAALAKKLYEPQLTAVFEFGGIGSALEELPLAVGESKTFRRAIAATGICDAMETAARGLIHYGFLGGAQIDIYGNLNTTVIGRHDKPIVRLPGAGGGNEVGSLCWKTIILMKHEKERFVKKLNFITTPGYIDGPGARERAGLPAGTGPFRVITNLAVFDFEPKSKKMRLIALNPGVEKEDAARASGPISALGALRSGAARETGFEFLTAKKLEQNSAPNETELAVLRHEVDRDKIFLR
ncbi:MAG: 3-oxoacid CoA-transferase [Elusimicrobia bacterium]|nr:3-oxoacid CoA-transferase [Elusimicrobiota bacterium]